jgi:hypothetical protein
MGNQDDQNNPSLGTYGFESATREPVSFSVQPLQVFNLKLMPVKHAQFGVNLMHMQVVSNPNTKHRICIVVGLRLRVPTILSIAKASLITGWLGKSHQVAATTNPMQSGCRIQ